MAEMKRSLERFFERYGHAASPVLQEDGTLTPRGYPAEYEADMALNERLDAVGILSKPGVLAELAHTNPQAYETLKLALSYAETEIYGDAVTLREKANALDLPF